MYFLRLLKLISAESNALFAKLVLPPKGGGEFVISDELQDPIPGRPGHLLGQPVASQLFLHFGEEEIVFGSQIRRIRWMFECLDSWLDIHLCTMAAV